MFNAEIKKLEPAIRCYQSADGQFTNWPLNDCLFGVPPDAQYGRKPLDAVPPAAEGFHFYLGSDATGLLEAFVGSDCARQAVRLSVGDSCYRKGSGRDYAAIVEILSAGAFPVLRYFSLGVWQLFSNSHCAYGRLGELGTLFAAMPGLEALSLHGQFSLASAASFPRLKTLDIQADDPITGINGGAVPAAAVSSLFSSDFPRLEEAYIDLEVDESEERYALPEAFCAGSSCPSLHRLEYSGALAPGEAERLESGPLSQRQGMTLFVEDTG